MGPGDLVTLSGITSPVTLAPRTAHPGTATGEIPPDLMAAIASSEAAAASRPVDIDLTLDSDSAVEAPPMDLDIDGTLGGSADKPIELDLDMDMEEMTGIFGPEPSSGGVDSLFSPTEARVKVEEIFPDFSTMENTGRDLFQSIDAAAGQNPGQQHTVGTGEALFDLTTDFDQSFIQDFLKSDQSAPAPSQGTSGGTGD